MVAHVVSRILAGFPWASLRSSHDINIAQVEDRTGRARRRSTALLPAEQGAQSRASAQPCAPSTDCSSLHAVARSREQREEHLRRRHVRQPRLQSLRRWSARGSSSSARAKPAYAAGSAARHAVARRGQPPYPQPCPDGAAHPNCPLALHDLRRRHLVSFLHLRKDLTKGQRSPLPRRPDSRPDGSGPARSMCTPHAARSHCPPERSSRGRWSARSGGTRQPRDQRKQGGARRDDHVRHSQATGPTCFPAFFSRSGPLAADGAFLIR